MSLPSSEEWRPIPDWPGYEASDRGHIRSVDRVVTDRQGRQHPFRGRVLSIWPNQRGYLSVRLSRDGSARNARVHQLVLAAFVGPRPPGEEGCHDNGDKTDCSLGNLRWDTGSANTYDRIRHGTHSQTSKTACPRNHPLVEPNLVVATSKDGHRACKACNRAHANVRKAKLRGEPYDFEALADDHYRRIIAPAQSAESSSSSSGLGCRR